MAGKKRARSKESIGMTNAVASCKWCRGNMLRYRTLQIGLLNERERIDKDYREAMSRMNTLSERMKHFTVMLKRLITMSKEEDDERTRRLVGWLEDVMEEIDYVERNEIDLLDEQLRSVKSIIQGVDDAAPERPIGDEESRIGLAPTRGDEE